MADVTIYFTNLILVSRFGPFDKAKDVNWRFQRHGPQTIVHYINAQKANLVYPNMQAVPGDGGLIQPLRLVT